MRRPLTFLACALVFLISANAAAVQDSPPAPPPPTLELAVAALESDQAVAAALPALARQAIAKYAEPDRALYLNNLFRLQLVAGLDLEAEATLRDLVTLRRETDPASVPRLFPFTAWTTAKLRQAKGGISLEEALREEIRVLLAPKDDLGARDAAYWFGGRLERMRQGLDAAVEKQKGKEGIALTDAVDLAKAYLLYSSFAVMMPIAKAVQAEDDARRYVVDSKILVKTPDGAQVAAILVRPRSAKGPVPTLLGFTVYFDAEKGLENARLTAAHGYAGVVAYTRGKGHSPDQPVPYEHDGADARAVIEWIARQGWSDGRVGMYGGSYDGFTQWAAAKHRPKALKALMPSVTNIPGIDTPMQGNVFLGFFYPWAPYVTANKGLDEERYGDREHWTALFKSWYETGRPYRDLDRIDGRPNPFYRRWLDHPSYDAYWQRLVPYQEEFAAIDIPVLTTTGYFDGGQVGALYSFTEHLKYNPKAEHYFLIGPYTHFGAQGRSEDVVGGYRIDPVARLDVIELRFQWFDYVFRGGKKPELLRDRINFQVLGANEWRHAPSVAAMSPRSRRYYLGAEREGELHRLSDAKSEASLDQRLDFTDRKDAGDQPAFEILDQHLDTRNSLAFATRPFTAPAEVSGQFSGTLEFVVNKKDFDLSVNLYEQLPSGEYLSLAVSHAYLVRASYAKNRSERKLLTPGKKQTLEFRSERLISRKLQAGSRLVMVLGLLKSPDFQINYGSGKDVSDESIADAGEPLQVRWLGSSFLDVPIAN